MIAAAALRLVAIVCAFTLAWPSPGVARTLVVYYASETTEAALASPNYRTLVAALEASPAPAAAAALTSLSVEAATFPGLVRNDITALREAAQRLRFDLIVFTNTLAAAGRFAQATPDGAWQERPFSVTAAATPDPILDFAPLARPAAFEAALAEVARLAPPDHDEIVLIVKSHGSETMAVMPRVVADLSRPGSAQELLARLASADDGRSDRPAWAEPKGIGKLALWQALAQAGARHGLHPTLVVLDSCRSGLLTLDEYRAVPSGMGAIVHSGTADIAFGQIDYASALAEAKPGEGLGAPLAAALQAVRLDSEGPAKRWWRQARFAVEGVPALLFFIPLALWLGWYVVRPRVRARRAP